MNSNWFLYLVLLTPLFFVSVVEACEGLRLENIEQIQLAPGQNQRIYTVQVVKDSGTCSYFITATAGNSSGYQRSLRQMGHELRYNLYTSQARHQVLKDLPQARPDETLRGVFQGSGFERQQRSYFVEVHPMPLEPEGLYEDLLELKLYLGDPGESIEWVIQRTLRVQWFQPQFHEIAVVPSGAGFLAGSSLKAIDLGNLEEGKQEKLDIIVRANSPYKVQIESEQRGRLKHESRESTVPYRTVLNGKTLNLASGRTHLGGGLGGTSGAGESRLPLLFEVGESDHALSGTYTDHLIITLEAP